MSSAASAFSLTQDGKIAEIIAKFGRSSVLWEAATVEWSDAMGPILLQAERAETPVKSGRLRDSLRYQRQTLPGLVRMEFHTNVPYYPFVVKPTAPHIIQPVAAQALHWHDGSGGEHFGKLVHHPGTRGNDFPARTLNSMKAELSVSYMEALRSAYKL